MLWNHFENNNVMTFVELTLINKKTLDFHSFQLVPVIKQTNKQKQKMRHTSS